LLTPGQPEYIFYFPDSRVRKLELLNASEHRSFFQHVARLPATVRLELLVEDVKTPFEDRTKVVAGLEVGMKREMAKRPQYNAKPVCRCPSGTKMLERACFFKWGAADAPAPFASKKDIPDNR